MIRRMWLCILSFALFACEGDHTSKPAVKSIALTTSKTYLVGPNKVYKNLQSVAKLLQPGDIVYVDGDAEYPGGVTFEVNATPESAIKIIGVSINGKAPIIRADKISNQILVQFIGNNYVFDNFEIIGNMAVVTDKTKMTMRGINQRSNGLVISHCIVHDARNGIMASDLNSGNLTIEFSNIYANGYSDCEHNIYIASDRVRVPNSVTKVMFNYIHDSKKGAGLKTRTSRNEIYYNWFENNNQSEVDMFGADLGEGSDPILDKDNNIVGYKTDNHITQDELRKLDKFYGESYLREDTDFVGNVVISNNKVKSLTIGGDGGSGGPTRNGTSFGRYRFVNNTFINTAAADGNGRSYVGQVKFGVGSLEFYNNIFYNKNGINIGLYFNPDDTNNDIHQTNSDLRWSNGKQITASNNWFKDGSKIPADFKNSIIGTSPGFVNLDANDYHLLDSSALQKSGTLTTVTRFLNVIYYSNFNGIKTVDNQFINPLLVPLYYPISKDGKFTPVERKLISEISIGAY